MRQIQRQIEPQNEGHGGPGLCRVSGGRGRVSMGSRDKEIAEAANRVNWLVQCAQRCSGAKRIIYKYATIYM